jgi:membrane protease YdiL (CAAX protease family)
MSIAVKALKPLLFVQWKPNRDLAAVAVSWLLVTGTLYLANIVIGPQVGGGLVYFGLYAVIAATLFGIGIPLYWLVAVRKLPLENLGITGQRLGISLLIQLVLGVMLYTMTLARVDFPSASQLIPLVTLSLAIGFFEAIFWRGWVQLRLEEAFGLIPAILLGSVLYAAYHVGYGMPTGEIATLFVIGLIFAAVFRVTKSVFILWPLFQPMGQLFTLINDGLHLPLLASLGFVEVLILMLVLVWLARRYHRKHAAVAKA